MYSPVGESATGGFPSRVLRVAQGVRGGAELTQKPPSMPACRSFAFTSPHLCTCLPFPGYPSLPSHAPCHSDPPKSPENSIQRQRKQGLEMGRVCEIRQLGASGRCLNSEQEHSFTSCLPLKQINCSETVQPEGQRSVIPHSRNASSCCQI